MPQISARTRKMTPRSMIRAAWKSSRVVDRPEPGQLAQHVELHMLDRHRGSRIASTISATPPWTPGGNTDGWVYAEATRALRVEDGFRHFDERLEAAPHLRPLPQEAVTARPATVVAAEHYSRVLQASVRSLKTSAAPPRPLPWRRKYQRPSRCQYGREYLAPNQLDTRQPEPCQHARSRRTALHEALGRLRPRAPHVVVAPVIFDARRPPARLALDQVRHRCGAAA